MGIDDAHGVVDPWGRVFNHPGLHIADGSVMPGPVGANPSLTIAALADRFADAIIEGRPEPGTGAPGVDRRDAEPPVSQAPGDAPSPDAPATGAASVRFTEEMKGYCTFGAEDFDAGYRAGREAGNSLMFHLTISTGDIERFIAEAQHEGVAEGWISGSAFGERLTVSGGQFNLFVDVATRHKRMWYRLPFADRNGRALTLVGYKEVRDDGGLDMWTDTTTLFTRVLEGHVAGERRPGGGRRGRDPAHPPAGLRAPADDVPRRAGHACGRARALWQAVRGGPVGRLPARVSTRRRTGA